MIPWLNLKSAAFEADLLEAYRDVGFAHLIGHDILPALRDQLFKASRNFHALPDAYKPKTEG